MKNPPLMEDFVRPPGLEPFQKTRELCFCHSERSEESNIQ
jgi:hypothetical protein